MPKSPKRPKPANKSPLAPFLAKQGAYRLPKGPAKNPILEGLAKQGAYVIRAAPNGNDNSPLREIQYLGQQKAEASQMPSSQPGDNSAQNAQNAQKLSDGKDAINDLTRGIGNCIGEAIEVSDNEEANEA